MWFHTSLSTQVAARIIKLIDKPTAQLRMPLTTDAVLFGLMKKVIPSFILNRFLYLLLPGSLKWGGKWRAADIKKASSEDSADRKAA